jgi:hypothetical protein
MTKLRRKLLQVPPRFVFCREAFIFTNRWINSGSRIRHYMATCFYRVENRSTDLFRRPICALLKQTLLLDFARSMPPFSACLHLTSTKAAMKKFYLFALLAVAQATAYCQDRFTTYLSREGQVSFLVIIGESTLSINQGGKITGLSSAVDGSVSYDAHDRIDRLGTITISYDAYDRPDRIGNVSLSYNAWGRVDRVGRYNINYDSYKRIDRFSDKNISYSSYEQADRIGATTISYNAHRLVDRVSNNDGSVIFRAIAAYCLE